MSYRQYWNNELIWASHLSEIIFKILWQALIDITQIHNLLFIFVVQIWHNAALNQLYTLHSKIKISIIILLYLSILDWNQPLTLWAHHLLDFTNYIIHQAISWQTLIHQFTNLKPTTCLRNYTMRFLDKHEHFSHLASNHTNSQFKISCNSTI